MQITFDPLALTDTERKVILAALGLDAPADVPMPAAKAAAPAKKAKKAAEPEVVEEAVEEVVEEEVVESVTETVTRADAMTLASRLVAEGRTADVKGVLAKYNAAKVSLLADEDLASFYVSLSAL